MESADWQDIQMELLNERNTEELKKLHREDVSESFVDTVETIAEITQYGIAHHCIGHTCAIKHKEAYIGLILLGEALQTAGQVLSQRHHCKSWRLAVCDIEEII